MNRCFEEINSQVQSLLSSSDGVVITFYAHPDEESVRDAFEKVIEQLDSKGHLCYLSFEPTQKIFSLLIVKDIRDVRSYVDILSMHGDTLLKDSHQEHMERIVSYLPVARKVTLPLYPSNYHLRIISELQGVDPNIRFRYEHPHILLICQ